MKPFSDVSDDRSVELKENLLGGVTIGLAIGGGIAATESVRLIRVLRRYGARVRVYAGRGALKFITATSLEWASGEPLVLEADGATGGRADHLFREDVLLVAPATLNVIAKSALGLADSLITTLIASALGSSGSSPLNRKELEAGDPPNTQTANFPNARKIAVGENLKTPPILMVPSMHASLRESPLFSTHQAMLSRLGVQWVAPREEEGKWKSPEPEAIALAVMRSTAYQKPSRIFGKDVLITAGSVPSYIDDIRKLTNLASGQTGLALAVYAHALGANVTLLIEEGKERSSARGELFGLSSLPFPVVTFKDYPSYSEKVFSLLAAHEPDWGIFIAAVTDYEVKQAVSGKLPSGTLKEISLIGTEKIVQKVRRKYANLKVVAFKLEANLTVAELIKKGEAILAAEDYTLLVANRLEDLTSSSHSSSKTSYPRYLIGKREALPTVSGDAGSHKTPEATPPSEGVAIPTHTNFELAQHLFGYSPAS